MPYAICVISVAGTTLQVPLERIPELAHEAGTQVFREAVGHEAALREAVVAPIRAGSRIVGAIVAYAPQAEIDLSPFPNLQAWMKRIEALPGYGAPDGLLPKESRAAA